MSEESKNLGDEAKDAAKKATEKAKETASELKEDAKEVFEDVKEEAKEFAAEAKETLSNSKTIAIVAHLTLIGWIIALIMNNDNKTEFSSFYIRQVLGIMLLGFLSFIPFLGILVGLFCFALWIVSLIGALGGTQKPVFLLGEQFQEWFKSI